MFSLKVELWVGVSYNLFWKKLALGHLISFNSDCQLMSPDHAGARSGVCIQVFVNSPRRSRSQRVCCWWVWLGTPSFCCSHYAHWIEMKIKWYHQPHWSNQVLCIVKLTARAKQVPAMAKKHLHQQAQWMYERDGLDPNAPRDASRVHVSGWKVNDLFLWLAAAAVFWVKHVKTWWICSALETSRINRVAVYLLNGLPLKKRVLNSNYCTAVLKNGSGENVRKTVLIGVFFPLWQADMWDAYFDNSPNNNAS